MPDTLDTLPCSKGVALWPGGRKCASQRVGTHCRRVVWGRKKGRFIAAQKKLDGGTQEDRARAAIPVATSARHHGENGRDKGETRFSSENQEVSRELAPPLPYAYTATDYHHKFSGGVTSRILAVMLRAREIMITLTLDHTCDGV